MSSDSSATPQHPFIRQVNRQTNSHYHHRFHSHQSRVKSIRRRLLFDSEISNLSGHNQRSSLFQTGPVALERLPLCIFWSESFAGALAPFGIQLRVDSNGLSRTRHYTDPPPLGKHQWPLCHCPLAMTTSMTTQDQATTCGVCGVPRECQHEELSRLWVASRSGTEFMYR